MCQSVQSSSVGVVSSPFAFLRYRCLPLPLHLLCLITARPTAILLKDVVR